MCTCHAAADNAGRRVRDLLKGQRLYVVHNSFAVRSHWFIASTSPRAAGAGETSIYEIVKTEVGTLRGILKLLDVLDGR